MNQFKETFKKTVSKTNSFFKEDWFAYMASIEKIEISPFKDFKIFTTN